MTPMRLRLFYSCVVLLTIHIFDVALTWAYSMVGFPEGNAIALAVWNHYGPFGAIAIKAIGMFFLFYMTFKLTGKESPKHHHGYAAFIHSFYWGLTVVLIITWILFMMIADVIYDPSFKELQGENVIKM